MELTIALIIFAAMIVVWFTLPGSVTAEETPSWTSSNENMPVSPAKA
jgi:hypothetical protein